MTKNKNKPSSQTNEGLKQPQTQKQPQHHQKEEQFGNKDRDSHSQRHQI